MGSLYLSTPEPKGLFGIGILHRILNITLQKSDPLRTEAKYCWSFGLLRYLLLCCLRWCTTLVNKPWTAPQTSQNSTFSIRKWNSPSLLFRMMYTKNLLCPIKMFSFIHFLMFLTQICVAAAVKSFIYFIYLLHIWLVKAFKTLRNHLGEPPNLFQIVIICYAQNFIISFSFFFSGRILCTVFQTPHRWYTNEPSILGGMNCRIENTLIHNSALSFCRNGFHKT